MPSSAVLVPLYIYPFPGAWTPLYHAIEANPSTQFLVIINPGNGPGPSSLPDANYCHEIPKLRSHSNVAVFGYVHVSWGRRDLDEVRRDVEIYAAWPEHQHDTFQPPCQDQNVSDTRLAIDGIFVDETPILAHEHEVSFLGSLTSLVHSIWPSIPALTSGTPVSDLDSAAKVPTVSYMNLIVFHYFNITVLFNYPQLYCQCSTTSPAAAGLLDASKRTPPPSQQFCLIKQASAGSHSASGSLYNSTPQVLRPTSRLLHEMLGNWQQQSIAF